MIKLKLPSTQLSPTVNVRITKRNVHTGEITYDFKGKNRVTKTSLMGYIRFINGEFNPTTPENMDNYIPRYLALGTNRAGTINQGVTTEVTVNDAKLLDELPPRILLTQKNIVNNIQTNPFITLTIKCFIPVDLYVGDVLGEAGLFCKETGNNCFARIAFNPITKSIDEVIDVQWEITVISVGDTVYPTSIQLDSTTLSFTLITQRAVLTPTILPANTTLTTVTWTSSDETVATVDLVTGTIAPVADGTCTITATTVNNLIAMCTVTVAL